MLKKLICAAAILCAAVSSASAQLVLFSGAGYVTAATNPCFNISIFQNLFLIVGYLPANLGTNGADGSLTYVSIPQAVQPFATNLAATGPSRTPSKK